LLLDDELPGLTYLKMLCEQIPEIEVVKAFNNPHLFLEEVVNIEFDLCILDIEMPGINGLEIAKLLNGKAIIFSTAYSEYAADAFDLDVIDYLRKPIKLERLQQAIQKATAKLNGQKSKKNYIQLNTDKGKTILFFDQLCYIKTSEIDSRDKIALLTNNSTLVLKNITFEKLITWLPTDQFCRVNKQELIALRVVQFFSHSDITTTLLRGNGQPLTLLLSEIYRTDFLSKFSS
jgi:DNA-binding LytR/AlgR family response regulator